jgi:MFS transporter, NNP family, nitrate/nitrite transporter
MIMSDVNISTPTTRATRGRLGGPWIDDWRPENGAFWDTIGKAVARRNLIYSVFSEHIGFSIWSIWSVLVLFLGPEYGFDPVQKFLLTAAPTLVGALLRLPYTFAVGEFGGRNWTIVAALLLLVPSIMIVIVLTPGVSFNTLLIVSLFAGVGGGNFASSMTNINTFYPARSKAGRWGSTPAAATSVCRPCNSSVCWYWRLLVPSTRGRWSPSTSP